MIVYSEPFTGRNRLTLGFNVYSDPIRREAMERARDTSRPAISSKVKLIQEITKDAQSGFLMFLPIFRPGADTESVEGRRKALLGHAFISFRTDDLMLSILGKDSRDVDLELYDEEATPENLLFDSRAGEVSGKRGQHMADLPIILGSHRWLARFQSTPEFDLVTTSYLADSIIIVGMLLALMVFSLLWNNARKRQQIEAKGGATRSASSVQNGQ